MQVTSKKSTETVCEFNHCLNNIFKIIKSQYNDAELKQLYEKFLVFYKEMPLDLIKNTESLLWKYGEQIMKEDVQFFIRNDFKKDLVSDHEINTSHILSICKTAWTKFHEYDQHNIIKWICGMLSAYAKFLSVEQVLQNGNVAQ